MHHPYGRIIGALVLTMVLTGCFGGNDDQAPPAPTESNPENIEVSGAKAGAYSIVDINRLVRLAQGQRPSAPVGIYAVMHLASGLFAPVQSATTGIDSLEQFFATQERINVSERYTLLEDFGSILKIDIHEHLDRSTDRPETLDAYLDALEDAGSFAKVKLDELEAEQDDLKDELRDKNRIVKDLEKAVRDAEKEGNFNIIADLQEQVGLAQTEAADVEVEEKQIDDLIDSYKKLIEIGSERFDAISKNRQLILSGLNVVDAAGIDDLHLIEGKRRSNSTGIFGGE